MNIDSLVMSAAHKFGANFIEPSSPKPDEDKQISCWELTIGGLREVFVVMDAKGNMLGFASSATRDFLEKKCSKSIVEKMDKDLKECVDRFMEVIK